MCTSNRNDRKLEKTPHAQTSSGKGLPSHFWNRNIVRSILPGLRRKITELSLGGPKSSFQIKVDFAFNLEIRVSESGRRVERHRIHVAWRPVWRFPQSVMIWAAMSSAGVGPLCFLKSTAQCSHLPGHFRALHALWRCWFHFPAGLGTCPHCQRYQKLVQWPWCYCAWLASKLAWPERHRESIQYRWPEGRYQSNLGFHSTWAVPQADCLYATAIFFLETLPNNMWWCRCGLTSFV